MDRNRVELLIKAGFLKGVVGKVGNWVFRRQQGGQIVYYPKYEGRVSNTPKQQKSRSKFREAVHYANKAMQIPDIKAAYLAIAKNNNTRNVHLLATQNYLKGIHIPLPVPPSVTKYASWEEILREIHQMQSLALGKRRRRSRIALDRQPIASPLPRKVNDGDRRQGKCAGNRGYCNTT